MDYLDLSFIGLITIGVVNVVMMIVPKLDSRIKFAIALVVAFGLTFVPTELGSVLADKIKLALEIAFASSGTYKLFTKAGGA